MWRAKDGRVFVRMLPIENVPGGETLVGEIRNLDPAALDDLDEMMMSISEMIADAIDEIPYSEAETEFVEVIPPSELLGGLDWSTLIGENAAREFALIDLRWRFDVLAIIEQVVADAAVAGDSSSTTN